MVNHCPHCAAMLTLGLAISEEVHRTHEATHPPVERPISAPNATEPFAARRAAVRYPREDAADALACELASLKSDEPDSVGVACRLPIAPASTEPTHHTAP